MSKTYNELKLQYAALRQTYEYIASKKDALIDFFNKNSPVSLTYIGCGSGFCLCQSGEISAKLRLGMPATAIASGDLLINCDQYLKLLDGSMLIAPSRSGSTSEVVKAINNVKEIKRVPVLAISCVAGSELSKIADFALELPWAFDESVCQTRTVVNLYAANLLILAHLCGDVKLLEDIDKIIDAGANYMDRYEDELKVIAEMDWTNAVILADGEMQGIACEGAVALTEIAQVSSHYYHLLDVRHGPMVLVGNDTLVVACITNKRFEYQKSLICDVVKRGARVVVYSSEQLDPIDGVSLTVSSGMSLDSAVSGIPFILIPQVIAYFKSVNKGLNADEPAGLAPWIKL